MSAKPEIERLLAQAVASAQAGRREQAYNLLLNVVELDRYNETAWLWLSTVTDNVEDQRICLENILTINPDNAPARERLAGLGGNGYGGTSSHIICPQCGAGNRDFVTECGACGYAFVRRCPRCSAFNSVEAQACSECGAELIQSLLTGGLGEAGVGFGYFRRRTRFTSSRADYHLAGGCLLSSVET